jgi:hypothetical protein
MHVCVQSILPTEYGWDKIQLLEAGMSFSSRQGTPKKKTYHARKSLQTSKTSLLLPHNKMRLVLSCLISECQTTVRLDKTTTYLNGIATHFIFMRAGRRTRDFLGMSRESLYDCIEQAAHLALRSNTQGTTNYTPQYGVGYSKWVGRRSTIVDFRSPPRTRPVNGF